MRKLIYQLLLLLTMVVGARGSERGSPDNASILAMIGSVDIHGLQRMQASKSETDLRSKGKDHHSPISRTPDENLLHVTNELGDTYVDNRIVLHLTRGNETVLNKTFTRSDLLSVVDANFLPKSILEGIVYDKTTPQGVMYAVNVCYPQTDLYMPPPVTITADGKMSIQKVDILEEDYNDKTPD